MSFQQGLSGLNAAARNLDVIGNNVANANTVGAKAARAEFADLYASSMGSASTTAGSGVTVSSVAQQFTQGDIVSTQNPLDMAINGSGFFRTTQNGSVEYTRNGQFRMDKDGYIVTSKGAHLSGFPAGADGSISAGTPADMRISMADLAPKPTAKASAQFNLDARDDVPTGTFDSADSSTYNSSMSLKAVDSLGRDHVVSLYYVKTGDNAWNVHAAADGTDVAGFTQSLTFSSTGALTSPTDAFDITVPVGADAGGNLTFALDLSKATQFGAPFGTNEISQDGYGTGRLVGVSVDENGLLNGRYTNGQTKVQGQVALANFANPQALQSVGNNAWVETAAAGQATVGAPDTGTLGSLQSSALENSNVDLTAELVNMISAQRFYQANAQTIKTADTLMQTIVNLR